MGSLHLLHRFRLLGITFLALLLLGVWLTYAQFTNKFADFDKVTLQTSSVGLSLPTRADVKARGVIVGEVLEAHSDAKGARLVLGIKPDHIKDLPRNVTGSILPKTLFGEKYVSLVVPKQRDGRLRSGDTITRTAVSTELDEVLTDLYPLLRTVQPAELNRTLNALATALEGRGERLGQTLETTDAYLRRLNPQIPALVEDLKLTVGVADTYADVMPEIATILRNSITTTGTLEDNSAQLRTMLGNVTRFSGTAEHFLAANEQNLISLAEVNDPLLETAARYAPEYPCLLGGIDALGKRVSEAFRGHVLHIKLETLPRQPRAYGPQDRPHFGEDRGPACGHLPIPPWSQSNPLKISPDMNDGVDESTGKGTSRAATGFGRAGTPTTYVGSSAEHDLLAGLLAPSLGVRPEQVSDLGPLLVGPLARGATVSYR